MRVGAEARRKGRRAGRFTTRWRHVSASVLAATPLVILLAAPLDAQLPELQGYWLGVGGYARETALNPDGFFTLQRVRLMTRPVLGPLTLDMAYEHVLELRSEVGSALVEGVGGVRTGGDWLDLEGTIRSRERIRWRHHADRLSVTAGLPGGLTLRMGRQTISWASTLLLTPADPFAPFDPADPFREFRGGVDGLRLQLFPGPFTEVEAVVRPVKVNEETLLTALGRWKGLTGGWEVSGWGGILHDRFGAGVGTVGAAGPVAIRGEASLRRSEERWVLRGAAGADGRRVLAGRDLFFSGELRYDGFGAEGGNRLAGVLGSPAYERGELQLLGRWAVAATATLQAHPLLSTELLVLASLSDGSALLGPGFSYSVSDEVSLRAGGFVGLGSAAEVLPGGGVLPRSEFGLAPSVFYAALSAYF